MQIDWSKYNLTGVKLARIPGVDYMRLIEYNTFTAHV